MGDVSVIRKYKYSMMNTSNLQCNTHQGNTCSRAKYSKAKYSKAKYSIITLHGKPNISV